MKRFTVESTQTAAEVTGFSLAHSGGYVSIKRRCGCLVGLHALLQLYLQGNAAEANRPNRHTLGLSIIESELKKKEYTIAYLEGASDGFERAAKTPKPERPGETIIMQHLFGSDDLDTAYPEYEAGYEDGAAIRAALRPLPIYEHRL